VVGGSSWELLGHAPNSKCQEANGAAQCPLASDAQVQRSRIMPTAHEGGRAGRSPTPRLRLVAMCAL
jgi:hypothetical protein